MDDLARQGHYPTDTDDLIDKMEQDELEDRTHSTGLATPSDYAKLRGLSPQLVYYYIRTGQIEQEFCPCGRKVVMVAQADEALAARSKAQGRGVSSSTDSNPENG